jgi:hypothetical protein
MTTVVPQPGATLPYSEFKGFKAVPKAVTFPFVTGAFPFDVVAILFSYKFGFFYFPY